MMKRGIILFIVVNLFFAWLLCAAIYALQDKMGQFAGLLMLPLMFVPFIMAYVAHTFSGAAGNPFRGLVWGHSSWYFVTWLLGLLAGAVVLALVLGLRMASWDSQMGDYVQMVADMSAERGQAIPEQAMGTLKISGYFTAFFAPTLGPWFGAALGCLATFAWFGWLGRRLLVYGRGTMVVTLMILYALTSFGAGIIDNPTWNAVQVPVRMALMGLAAVATIPAALWVFLKTRSAVLAALALASFQGGYSFATPFLSEANPMFAPPLGLMIPVVALLAGLALWVFKDPGGMELAVAAVAYDGTPLTPEQYRSLEEHEHAAPSAPSGGEYPPTPPPPPDPPAAG